MANNKYPQEFRDEAVRQILDRGYAIKDVAKSLGVPAHNLYKWVKQVRPAPERRKEEELLEAKREVLKLRADLHRVEEERDILKKAAVYFARQPA
jgi:transposase